MLQHNIKLLRQQKSMTQKQLADELHVTPQAVSRWENGEVEPSVSAIGEMAKIFGVTYDELMRGKEDNLPEEEIAATKDQPLPTESQPSDASNNVDQDQATEKILYREAKPVLAVCEICNKPIYDGNEIVKERNTITSVYVNPVRKNLTRNKKTKLSNTPKINDYFLTY